MTDSIAAPQPITDDTSVSGRLAAAVARTTSTRARKTTTRARKTTPKKTAPATSRASRAASRGKYADRIAPAVKAGAMLLMGGRNPVGARVIVNGADAWAASLDRVAAEDPRVDALLTKVSGLFGKGGAWGEFGVETVKMSVGVYLATGAVPGGGAGMIFAMFAGQALDVATRDVARSLAEAEAVAFGRIDADGAPIVDSRDIELHYAALIEQRETAAAERAAARAAGADPEPDPDVIEHDQDMPSPFAAWK